MKSAVQTTSVQAAGNTTVEPKPAKKPRVLIAPKGTAATATGFARLLGSRRDAESGGGSYGGGEPSNEEVPF